MNVGDLVKITRTSIGVPTGTIGLILEHLQGELSDIEIYVVQLCNAARQCTYLPRDLEVISASR